MDYIFDVLLILLIYIKVVYPKIKYKEKKRKQGISLFFMYLVIVYALTLMPFRPLENFLKSGFNFDFHLYAFSDVVHSYGPAYREAFLNVLMLVPFGFLFPFIFKKDVDGKKILLFSFLFSFGIEFLQLLDPGRSSDLTDLITNSSGGLLGFVLFKIFIHYKNKRESLEL